MGVVVSDSTGSVLRSFTVSFPLLMLTTIGGGSIVISIIKGLNVSLVLF